MSVPMPELPGIVNDTETKTEDVVSIITQMILGESVMVSVRDLEEVKTTLVNLQKVYLVLGIAVEDEDLSGLISNISERIDLYNRVVDKYGPILKGEDNA